MIGCLSCLPLPHSPPSGWGSLCACVKILCKRAKKQSLFLGVYSWSKNCSPPRVQFMLALAAKPWSALNAVFPLFLPCFCPWCFARVLVYFLFPGLSLQGVCLVLELAASIIREPSLGDCDALGEASTMVHDPAVTVWAGRGGSERQGKIWPLLNILPWDFVTFIQILHVWDKQTFNDEFSFWPLAFWHQASYCHLQQRPDQLHLCSAAPDLCCSEISLKEVDFLH